MAAGMKVVAMDDVMTTIRALTVRFRMGLAPVRARAILAAGVVALAGVCVVAPGCDQQASRSVGSVKLGGKWFHLEISADNATRVKGLSGREFIEPDGGMLFAFPRPSTQQFVMRDCPIPIDIIFLDGSGRITAMHAMVPEEPRREGESDGDYEERLKRYPSRFAAQFAIELAGGTLPSLGLKDGDQVDLDVAALKAMAK